eukprot:4180895-Prymnesium_polylepis.1
MAVEVVRRRFAVASGVAAHERLARRRSSAVTAGVTVNIHNTCKKERRWRPRRQAGRLPQRR